MKHIKTFESLFTEDTKIKPYEKLLIDSVINFMKDKFDFDAKITVKKKNNERFFGDISLSDSSINKNKFILHYNPNASIKYQITSLIHELIHVKQVVKKELGVTSDWKNITWYTDIISVKDYKKSMKDINIYKNLPFEKEAYEYMEIGYNEYIESDYFKSLKGKDINLDFIIDNI